MNHENTTLATRKDVSPALLNAVQLWADATTDAGTTRRRDLLRDKTNAVKAFFTFTGKRPADVSPIDVKVWQAHLEDQGLAPSTVYSRISRVSSWFRWALADETLSETLHQNPVQLARPKAPKAYQTDATQALTDDEMAELVDVIRWHATQGVVGKRDYALLLFYLATGMRRAEVIRLCWGDVRVNGGLHVKTVRKGGEYVETEVKDVRVKDALLAYLRASGRLDGMEPDTPLWTAHDRTGLNAGRPLSSHGFAKRMKRYALLAGIPEFHLHQTRHTFARMVAEDTGSIVATQDALGHKHAGTTRVYVQRIATKRDKHSTDILDRLGV